MIEENKSYWLSIVPNVYCCIKQQRLLLYNTANGESLEERNELIIALINQLYEKNNLGTIDCQGEMLTQHPYREFVSKLLEKKMCSVIDIAFVPEKPVQMMPVLNLQCDVDRLQNIGDRNVGEDVLHYLLELNIYLNDECDQHCVFCNKYDKQCLCCKTNNEIPQFLDLLALRKVLVQISHGVVGKLNILGGNVFHYPFYSALPELLTSFEGQIHVWNHYANFIGAGTLKADFRYDVVVPFPIDEKKLQYVLSSLKGLLVNVHFYITQTFEYERIENFVEQYEIENYVVHPIYINNNLTFFEENVYMNREDIIKSHYSFNHIFTNQKLNSHFFGSLSILSNGDTYANVNSTILGNVSSDTLIEIINKEMTLNTAWRKTRNSSPCSDCLCQYLCPPPTNYEMLIGRSDLCYEK